MAKNEFLRAGQRRAAVANNPEDPRAAIYERCRELIDGGDPAAAAEELRAIHTSDLRLANAYGVCMLRLGHPDHAVGIYRKLVLSGGVCLRPDVPEVVKSNFATALLLAGNLEGCRSVLNELPTDHFAAEQLREAIRRWASQLTLWERIRRVWESSNTTTVPLDFPPGELL